MDFEISAVLRGPRRRPVSVDRGPAFTFHARQRMHELHVGLDDVLRTFRAPSMTFPVPGGALEFVGDAVTLIVDGHTNEVITVKLHCSAPYVHGIHHLENLPH